MKSVQTLLSPNTEKVRKKKTKKKKGRTILNESWVPKPLKPIRILSMGAGVNSTAMLLKHAQTCLLYTSPSPRD